MSSHHTTTLRRPWRRIGVATLVAGLALGATVACGSSTDGVAEAPTPRTPAAAAATATPSSKPPAISLGRGLVAFPDEARAWVKAHPKDARTPKIAERIASQPTALWLTGDESFGNLATDVALARKADRTMVLTLWNIPFRWDGLSSPSQVTLSAYRAWITRIVKAIGTTRAIIVLEPDALWFYDRLPTAADRTIRMSALRYAVAAFKAKAPRSRVYLEAGTASGSVTPERMAKLLRAAHVTDAAGYAVNVSSYAPRAKIWAYAKAIRASLQQAKIADPRFVIDTGRNGAPTWDNNWCNPPQQRLGSRPRLVRSASGLDLALWVKAPGTSDGDCGGAGRGLGSQGGEFLPAVAYSMITGR